MKRNQAASPSAPVPGLSKRPKQLPAGKENVDPFDKITSQTRARTLLQLLKEHVHILTVASTPFLKALSETLRTNFHDLFTTKCDDDDKQIAGYWGGTVKKGQLGAVEELLPGLGRLVGSIFEGFQLADTATVKPMGYSQYTGVFAMHSDFELCENTFRVSAMFGENAPAFAIDAIHEGETCLYFRSRVSLRNSHGRVGCWSSQGALV